MYEYVLPPTIVVGDRIPNLDNDGPAVVALGEVRHDEQHGDMIPVTVEGEEDPRLMHVDALILVRRQEPAAPAEPAPAPA